MSRSPISLLSLLIVLSCSRTTGLPEPVPPSSPEITTGTPRITDGAWTFTQDTRPISYTTVSTAALELHLDTLSQHDTLSLTTTYTLFLSGQGESTKLAGSVDHLLLQTGERIGRFTDSISLPLRFTGQIAGNVFLLDSANSIKTETSRVCTRGFPGVFAVIQRNLLIVPRTITAGMIWKDSVVSVDCSGSIPVSLHAGRQYRVAGETTFKGRRLILIERSDRTTATGEGAQGQHRVTLKAEGSGLVRLYVDVITGRLEAAEGEQRSQVIVTASGRAQRFQQIVREETVRTGSSN